MASGHHPAQPLSLSNLACVQPLKSKEIRMGTPLFAASFLFTPLQQFARWMARPSAGARGRSQAVAPAAHAAHAAHAARAPEIVRARPAVRRPPPVHAARTTRLRVVRVFEGQAAAGAGRMVISGRMADVCAELERLAALETAAG